MATTGPLSYEDWLSQNTRPSGKFHVPGVGDEWTSDAQHAYDIYTKQFKAPTTTTPTKPVTPQPAPPTTVVPGKPVPGSGQVNVVDYASQVVTNPSIALTQDDPSTPDVNESMSLAGHVQPIDQNAPGTVIDPNDPRYAIGTGSSRLTAYGQPSKGYAAQVGQTATAAQIDPREAETYQAQLTQQQIAQNGQMVAQQGQLSGEALIDPNEVPQLDIQGTATGFNADGSINYTGQALNEYAQQDLGTVDPKATLKGQLEILQSEFVGPDGEPKIPAWAAATARGVSRIAAFRGMTGTAATAAMSQAMLEGSITVAQQDAQFFQTLTLQNLSNKQASILNKAAVLAKFDEINVDNRMAAAIQNSKNFLEMDLRNLDNRQQAEMLNTQARVQSILEDAKAVNTQRMFTAESANEMGKFYDQLSTNIEQFNATQKNQMSQFNVAEKNQMSQFNVSEANKMKALNVQEINAMTKFRDELETNRQQFYKNMQYNIDVSNAKWRQTVTLTENQQQFEAAAADVKNLVGISVEQMNQLWDRSDSLLDYLWKSTESELDRNAALSIEKFRANASSKAADKAGWGSVVGSIVGAGASSFFDAFDW